MSKSILLVEDDQDTAAILIQALQNADYSVVHKYDGTALLENEHIRPDLYILDYTVPPIDGIAICKYLKVKNRTKHIPVIIISGKDSIETKVRDIGASAFVSKPFSVNKLLDTVRVALANPE